MHHLIFYIFSILLFSINSLNARILAPSNNENTLPSIVSSKPNQTLSLPKNINSDSINSSKSTTNTTDNEDTMKINISIDENNTQPSFSKIIVIHNSFQNNNYLKTMIGIMKNIDSSLYIIDSGVNVAKNNILTNAYLLYNQTLFWPARTIFIFDSGSFKHSSLILAITQNNQIIITSDSRILTLFVKHQQLKTVRTLDTSVYKYQTIDGHDTIFYVGASVIKKNLDITSLGDELPISKLKLIDYPSAKAVASDTIKATIFISNNHNNVITNISSELFNKTFNQATKLENQKFKLKINQANTLLFQGIIPFNHDYIGNKTNQALSFYKNFLIIKNLHLTKSNDLANAKYKITITKIK